MTGVNISVTGGMAEGISGRFAIHRDKYRTGRSLPRWLVRAVSDSTSALMTKLQ